MAEQTPREIAINVLSCNHHCSPSMIAIGLHDDPLCPARNRPELEAAITAAVEHERERCAKLCNQRADLFNSNEDPNYRDGVYLAAKELAEAIKKGSTDLQWYRQ